MFISNNRASLHLGWKEKSQNIMKMISDTQGFPLGVNLWQGNWAKIAKNCVEVTKVILLDQSIAGHGVTSQYFG